LIVLASVIGLLLLISVLVNVTAVQNFLIHKTTAILSEKLHTRVAIRHVNFRLFNRFVLEGTYIADQHDDTLLYADKLSVNVTNFFFLRNKTYIYQLSLQHATVNLRRAPGDSNWNYQFILNALGTSSDSTRSTPSKPPNLSIRRLTLEDVNVNQVDGYRGEDMHVHADRIALNARDIDLRRRRILIRQLDLDHPLFVLVEYPSTAPPSSPSVSPPASASPDTGPHKDSLRWNPDHWTLQVGRIQIRDGGFALLHRDEPQVEPYFDPRHIAFFDVNATLNNTRLVQDSLITDLSLSTKERCGLVVKKLACRFKFSPVEMEFSGLDLITNRSHITDYYAMQYSDFSDMSDFLSAVFLRGHFKDATVSSDDIAFFAPALDSWKTEIRVAGEAYGTISNLTGRDMHIRAGNSTELEGRIKMRGLPDIDNTFIDFEADRLTTTGRDVQQFIPDLTRQDAVRLDGLTRISFTGNYTGFIQDFVAYGDFQTNLGNVHSDLNMKFGARYEVPVYSGNLSAENFDLGALLDQQMLGPVTFKAQVDGSGFQLNDLNAKVDGEIEQIFLNGYTYHQVRTVGTFDKKLFSGLLEVADPNLALNFAGTVDFNGGVPQFKFQSEVAHSDLRLLNLTKDSITFSGNLDLNFTGDRVDNFLGVARLYDINLYKSATRVAFDTLVIHSQRDSAGGKLLTLQGNEIQGFLKGQYNFKGLPHVVDRFLSHYYPSRFSPPPDSSRENFTFGFQLGNADQIIHSFLPQISGLDNARVAGSLNSGEDTLLLDVDIPTMGYDRYRFNDIQLHATGKAAGLGVTTRVGEVFLQDSLLLPGAEIKIASSLDTTYFNFKTSGAEALNNANIYARITTLKDGYNVKILNSELVVNDKTWRISPDNEITLRKNGVLVHNFNISHNEQRITLTSSTEAGDSSAFLIELQHLFISDFSQFFMSSPKLEGIADGVITVKDPLGAMLASAVVDATDFRVNDDSMGVVHATAGYDKKGSAVQWSLFKDDNPSRNFSMQGLVGLGKENQTLQGDFKLNHTNINILGTFIGDYVSQFSGTATGSVKLGGTTASPELTGAVKLDTLGLRVNYLGTYYTLANETVTFTPTAIDIGTMTLHDVYGHNAVLKGTISHRHFDEMNFDVSLNTQNFQLMHTTDTENPLYYGDAIASGRVDLSGPLKDLRMTVNITPLKGTHIYLPLSDSKDIGKHDFVIFKQYGHEMKPERPSNKEVNLSVKLLANMNPQALVDVIVDASSGDRISAAGNGALQMNMDLDGDFKMYGNYSIEKGNYIFSFKGLISRNFQINQGSTIAWNGDPANANVDITAIYDVPGGASLYDLVAGEAETSASGLTQKDQKLMRQRENVDVYLTLKGSLSHPDISYDIRLPDAGINTGSFAMTKLQQIKQNPNDLINQVAALLAFGQFIPPSSGNSSGALRSGGLSGAGQWVSSQLSGVLNNILGSTFRKLGVDFSLNYNAYSASGDYGYLQRNDVQFNLSKSIFNNRVRIEVGPSIDWGRTNTSQATNNSYFAGDFRFEYLITPDGRIRFMAFSRSNYDVLLNANLTRGGIGIAYSREFNRLHELFLSRQEKQRRDSIRTAIISRYMQANPEDTLPPTPVQDTLPSDTLMIPRDTARDSTADGF
jgi:hypothetical protein